MKAVSIALGLMLAVGILPVAAAPWETMDLTEGEYQLRYAFQTDDTGQYRFAVSCILGERGYNLFVMTPEAWQDTTSYAPEVPLAISFDGAARQNLQFFFANGGGFLMVAYRQENFAGELEQVLELLKSASRFDISYFDKALSFSAEGSTAAIESIQRSCGFI